MEVGRPKWTPQTDDQHRAIAAAKRAAKRADEADDLMWQSVQDALDLGVPAAFLADTVGRSRATLYRHTQPGAAATDGDTTDEV